MRKFLTAFALAALAARAVAADKVEAPDVYAKLNPKVGAWAEYAYASKKGDAVKRQGTFRVSVVGKEGDGYWIEEKLISVIPKPKKDRGPAYIKMLMTKEGAQKMYMKTGTMVIDMSSRDGAHKKSMVSDKVKITEAGEESVSVTAGKFKATRYAYVNGENTGSYWLKKGVGPYGLVKQAGKDGKGDKTTSTIDLLDSGSGAKSEVDEKSAQSLASMMGGRAGAGASAGAGAGSSAASGAGSSAASSFGSMFGDALKKKALGSH